jgi:CO dehydrogenase/acetyl-CoA synthase gamma subunit (corrinoid Fe-S protein)
VSSGNLPSTHFSANAWWSQVHTPIKENGVEQRLARSTMIIPGLAESEKNTIRQLTRFNVLIGPVSGFLAPLFVLANQEEFH